jgi:hypothetical protein
VGRGRPVRTAPDGGCVMTRQTGSPGVELPELHAALVTYLAAPRQPEPEPELLVQDPLPGMEPQ